MFNQSVRQLLSQSVSQAVRQTNSR